MILWFQINWVICNTKTRHTTCLQHKEKLLFFGGKYSWLEDKQIPNKYLRRDAFNRIKAKSWLIKIYLDLTAQHHLLVWINFNSRGKSQISSKPIIIGNVTRHVAGQTKPNNTLELLMYILGQYSSMYSYINGGTDTFKWRSLIGWAGTQSSNHVLRCILSCTYVSTFAMLSTIH